MASTSIREDWLLRRHVWAYDASGRLVWKQELPGYDGTRAGVNRNPPGIAFFCGMHQTRTITRLGRDLLVVQAQQTSWQRNPSNPSARLTSGHAVVPRILTASTGQVLTRQGGAPFLALTRGGVTVDYVRKPVPPGSVDPRACPAVSRVWPKWASRNRGINRRAARRVSAGISGRRRAGRQS